ncbi:unnamed protein product [Prorocentrum cordatum]|uniref:Uncharacterized protein n=1 Tax=Prorocentrum cordatum TaxID=2364126 RepID=A0ABN9SYL8_9DINO|nr:unnamed protein product [Polarella glacialis]
MKRFKITEETRNYLGANCLFRDKRMDNTVACFTLHQIAVSIFHDTVRSVVDLDILKLVWFSVLPMCVPVKMPAAGGRAPPMVFDRIQQDKCKWLVQAMPDSIVVKRGIEAARKLKEKAARPPTAPSDPNARTSGRSGAGKSSSKGAPKEDFTGANFEQHQVWLLDALHAIWSAMADCQLDPSDEHAIIMQLLGPALEFCFETKVRLGNVTYEKWSDLRPKLRDLAAATAMSRVGAIGADGDIDRVEMTVPDIIVASLENATPAASAPAIRPTEQSRLLDALQTAAGSECGERLSDFTSTNKITTTQPKRHPSCRGIIDALADHLGANNGEIGRSLAEAASGSGDAEVALATFLQHLLSLVYDKLSDVFDSSMMEMCQLTYQYVQLTAQMPACMLKYFKNVSELIDFMRLRPVYAHLAISDILCTSDDFVNLSGSHCRLDLAKLTSAARDASTHLRDVDRRLKFDQWVPAYTAFVTGACAGATSHDSLRETILTKYTLPEAHAALTNFDGALVEAEQCGYAWPPQAIPFVDIYGFTRFKNSEAITLAAGSHINLCVYEMPTGEFPTAYWLRMFMNFIGPMLDRIAYGLPNSEQLDRIAIEWVPAGDAAAGGSRPKPPQHKVVASSLDDLKELVFTGEVSLSRGSRSHLLCAIKVPATDPRDSLLMGIYVVPDKSDAATSKCPVPAWMVRVATDAKEANLIGQKRIVRLDLPGYLVKNADATTAINIQVTYLSAQSADSTGAPRAPDACEAGPVELARAALPGECMPKQRKSRCANQPPADVSALFGPTAASVHMAKLAAIEAGAETGQTGVTGGAQAQPQQGQRKKKCSCQHLLS